MTDHQTWLEASWMQTYTGRAFRPWAATADDIDPEDIAHALSLLCRYGGHTKRFYSVAEHSVHVSRHVPDADAAWGLMHDAAEAYVQDLVRPVKVGFPEYAALEARILIAIAQRFHLPLSTWTPSIRKRSQLYPETVVDVDNRILLDERASLLSTPPQDWQQDGLQPLGIYVHGKSPTGAKAEFVARMAELGLS